MANQNITLKKAANFLACNEVQIFRDHAIGLEIESTAMTVRIKPRQSKLAMIGKDKVTLTTPIENVECWKYYKKSHFKSDCSTKK